MMCDENEEKNSIKLRYNIKGRRVNRNEMNYPFLKIWKKSCGSFVSLVYHVTLLKMIMMMMNVKRKFVKHVLLF